MKNTPQISPNLLGAIPAPTVSKNLAALGPDELAAVLLADGPATPDRLARDLGVTSTEIIRVASADPNRFAWQPRSRLDGPGQNYVALTLPASGPAAPAVSGNLLAEYQQAKARAEQARENLPHQDAVRIGADLDEEYTRKALDAEEETGQPARGLEDWRTAR
jgi:hypothetical protein